jgi:hypothetical protein
MKLLRALCPSSLQDQADSTNVITAVDPKPQDESLRHLVHSKAGFSPRDHDFPEGIESEDAAMKF